MALASIAGGVALLAITIPVLMRFSTGTWFFPSSLLFGAAVGALLGGGVALSARLPTKRQEIELREDGFTIRGTAKFSVPYDELRGYSLIYPSVEGIRHRLLMLSPRVGSGCFSIGIPASVSDDAIRDLLDDRVPFRTIIDERALKIT